jgi:hypothetical protein
MSGTFRLQTDDVRLIYRIGCTDDGALCTLRISEPCPDGYGDEFRESSPRAQPRHVVSAHDERYLVWHQYRFDPRFTLTQCRARYSRVVNGYLYSQSRHHGAYKMMCTRRGATWMLSNDECHLGTQYFRASYCDSFNYVLK